MTPLFKKLNYKTQGTIVSINHPDSFLPELKTMSEKAAIIDSLNKSKKIEFVIVFATKLKEVDKAAEQIAKKVVADAVIWFCYPKGTSKKYICEFNRDNGWAKLGELGYEPVRAVAIDEDWSALRFRKPENIKTMTRSFAMTELGKKKVTTKKK